jgi:hypothetical protein
MPISLKLTSKTNSNLHQHLGVLIFFVNACLYLQDSLQWNSIAGEEEYFMSSSIPQVIATQQVSKTFFVRINKAVQKTLRLEGNSLHASMQAPLILSANPFEGSHHFDIAKNKFPIPEAVSSAMELQPKDRIALIEHELGITIKKIVASEQSGDVASLREEEDDFSLHRILTTNPQPEAIIADLPPQLAELRLQVDPNAYWKQRDNVEAWTARKTLGNPALTDDVLRNTLLAELQESQSDNGSWQDDLLTTAKNLENAQTLGASPDADFMRNAIDWILALPQSPHNPGMFFLTAQLVEKQISVVQDRLDGKGGRFRERRASEIRRVREVIPTAHDPCAPRLMWPNALVLDVLLQLGYEAHPRVQAICWTLRTQDWCECSYQHGLTQWRQKEPMTAEQVEAFEQLCKEEYRLGGYFAIDDLYTHTGDEVKRVKQTVEADSLTYGIQLPTHVQPCESVTTRSLSKIEDPLLRKFAVAHLWRFAGVQHPPDFTFSLGGQKHTSPYYYFELFSRYVELPIAQMVMLRMLPWIIADQNEDGSWCEGTMKDAATLSVIQGLVALKSILPGLLN